MNTERCLPVEYSPVHSVSCWSLRIAEKSHGDLGIAGRSHGELGIVGRSLCETLCVLCMLCCVVCVHLKPDEVIYR